MIAPVFRRLLFATAGVLAATLLAGFVWLLFYVFTAIAFSGSTGAEHRLFFAQFSKVPYAIAGAIAFGGLAAVVGTAVAHRGVRAIAITAMGILGAVYSLMYPPLGASLVRAALKLYQFIGVYTPPPY